jgi:ATP-binding cassette subfamily B protein
VTRLKTLKIPLRQYARLLSRYLRPLRKQMLLLAFLLFASLATQLVGPQMLRYFIDAAQSEKPFDTLLLAAAVFIGVTLVQQLFNVASAYIAENVGWIATNRLRVDVAEHCLRLDMTFHKSHTSGSIIERVDGDINALANFFSNFVISLLGNLLLVAGILALLYREGWLVGLGMTLFVVFAVWAIQYIRRFAAPHWGRLRQTSGPTGRPAM